MNAIIIVPEKDFPRGVEVMQEFCKMGKDLGKELKFNMIPAEEILRPTIMDKLLNITQDGHVPVVCVFTETYLQQDYLLFWIHYLRVHSLHWTDYNSPCQFLIPVYMDRNIRCYNQLFRDISSLLWYRYDENGNIVKGLRNRLRLQKTVASFKLSEIPHFTDLIVRAPPSGHECQRKSSIMQAAIQNGDLDYIAKNIHTFHDCMERGCQNIYEIARSVFQWNFPEAVQFLFVEDWPLDLDRELTWAIFKDNREMIELLCQMGAYPKGPIGWFVNGSVTQTMILMEHNILQPTLSFHAYYRGFKFHGFNMEVNFQGDHFICTSFPTPKQYDHENLSGLIQLMHRNGIRIQFQEGLLEVANTTAAPCIREVFSSALQPASLQSLCRKAIRNAMSGRQYKARVGELGLPRILRDYMCTV
jgi:hypothetical protein